MIHAVKRIMKRFLSRSDETKGFSLVETLVGMGLLAAVGIAFMQGVGVISISSDKHQERITASALAQAQIEEVKASAYNAGGTYPVTVTTTGDYTLQINVTSVETDLQQVTVEVYRSTNFILEITTYKTNR